jgi:hypothetical protein
MLRKCQKMLKSMARVNGETSESQNEPAVKRPARNFLNLFNKRTEKKKKEDTQKTKKKVRILIPKDAKLRKPKFVGNVLLTNPKNYIKDSMPKKIAGVIVDTFYEFASITKVNGMYYLRRFVTHGFQRFLWSCIMLFLLSFAVTLVYLLYRRFVDSPTRVTIDAPISIHEIPFPGVTICHPQNVMEYKSKEFLANA